MKLAQRIKPISYLKSNAAEIIRSLSQHDPMIITQNGEARAVLQDVESYTRDQETMALLKILALGNEQIEQKKVAAAGEVFRNIRCSKAGR